METKTIYLIRHGKIVRDDEQRSYIGQIDLPLTDEGREQARKLSSKLSKVKMDAVFSSDLARSLDSAKMVAQPHGLVPEVCTDLREIAMGDWEGLAFAEVVRRFPKEFKQRGADIGYFKPPNGESFADCCNRVIPEFHRIINSPGTNLAIVGHAGVNRVIICHLLGIPLANIFRLAQDYCCINIIIAGDFGLRLKRLNST